MNPIWKSSPAAIDQPGSPNAVLHKYAAAVGRDTQQQFVGLVTEAVREDTGEVSYALYLIVPRLRDYMYRLFEATVANLLQPYPVTLRYFAKDPRNNQTFRCETPQALEAKLVELISSTTTQNILGHLQQLVDINESYATDS